MREIKFRAWDNLEKRMRKVVSLHWQGDKPIETMKDCTIDHIVPISKGGLTAIENCQLAHRNCNLSKGNKEV